MDLCAVVIPRLDPFRLIANDQIQIRSVLCNDRFLSFVPGKQETAVSRDERRISGLSLELADQAFLAAFLRQSQRIAVAEHRRRAVERSAYEQPVVETDLTCEQIGFVPVEISSLFIAEGEQQISQILTFCDRVVRTEAVGRNASCKTVLISVANERFRPFVHVGERSSPRTGHGFIRLAEKVDEEGHSFLTVQLPIQTVDRDAVRICPRSGEQSEFIKDVRGGSCLLVRSINAGCGENNQQKSDDHC